MIFKEVIAELGYVGDDGARGALKQAPGLFNHVPRAANARSRSGMRVRGLCVSRGAGGENGGLTTSTNLSFNAASPPRARPPGLVPLAAAHFPPLRLLIPDHGQQTRRFQTACAIRRLVLAYDQRICPGPAHSERSYHLGTPCFYKQSDAACPPPEVECWSQASTSLGKLSSMLAQHKEDDPVGRVHRLLSQWPSDDALPTDGIDGVRSTYKKLLSGLNDVKSNTEKEVE